MIIVRTCGGLVNQLFQYVLGKKLSLLNNTDFIFDISLHANNKNRPYRLSNFCIYTRTATAMEVLKYKHLSKFAHDTNAKYRIAYIEEEIVNKKGRPIWMLIVRYVVKKT